jgi:hypothetical protein
LTDFVAQCSVCATATPDDAAAAMASTRRHHPEDGMLNFNDLFQWERFITPSIIQIFFWLVICLIGLSGIAGIAAAVATMSLSAVQGSIMLVITLLCVATGVLFARIATEFVLMVFRINEHLGAIRNRGDL